VQRRIAAHTEQAIGAATQGVLTTVQRDNAMNTLWSRFQSQHADLAAKSALISGVANVVVSEYRAAGIDPAVMAIEQPDAFIKKVADRAKLELGLPAGTNLPANRTNGVQGGSQPGDGSGKKTPKVLSFAQQMRKQAMKDGLI
jgi:hypothetical protein